MYSRRFAETQREVPPDYSGVAYPAGRPDAREGRPEENEREEPPREEDRGICPARRPLYRAPRGAKISAGRETRNAHPGQKPGAKGFSGEDLLLAGLILMLLSDREDGEKPDGEMLLLLGLLLFMQ